MCGIVFALECNPASINSGRTAVGSNKEGHDIDLDQATGKTRLDTPLKTQINDCQNGQIEPSGQEQWWESITRAVNSRGPDFRAQHILTLDHERQMRFHSSVLHMRGQSTTPQPFVDPTSGDVLCWNGEIFDGLKASQVTLTENDGFNLFSTLVTRPRSTFSDDPEAPDPSFLAILDRIEGPYALVYYDSRANRVWFGRDHLGRRSLLLKHPTCRTPWFLLSSNSTLEPRETVAQEEEEEEGEWEEVGAEGLWWIDLDGQATEQVNHGGLTLGCVKRRPIQEKAGSENSGLFYPYGRLNTTVPRPSDLLTPVLDTFPKLADHPTLSKAVQGLKDALLTSIQQRVLNIPPLSIQHSQQSDKGSLSLDSGKPNPREQSRIGILFSGGLDCTTLALLVDQILSSEQGQTAWGTDQTGSIDLINVAFENPRTLQSQIAEAKKKDEAGKTRGKRMKKGSNGPTPKEEGGVDLKVKDEVVVVDHVGTSTVPAGVYDVPDRLTGRASWEELRKLRPNRKWNFVEVDVPYQEMLEHRPKVIALMKPQKTVMDLSISLAFYFASRGMGHLAHDVDSSEVSARLLEPQPYHSRARVLLSGLGADELLGGYARHRKAFYTHSRGSAVTAATPNREVQASWTHLIQEMQMDLDRLPIRNLGRDDRIVSTHAKEARYPFLDAKVIAYCVELPIWIKTDPRWGEGFGDKLLLRLLAQDLGLQVGAKLKKRAIHFGARTAKMEVGSGRDKGEDDVSAH